MANKNLNRRQFVTAASVSSLAAMVSGIFPAFSKNKKSKENLSFNDNAKSWLEINKMIYGAKPDKSGPIGGGKEYNRIITGGDYTADTLEGLLDALAKAKAGQVVFIPSGAIIDMTTRIYIDKITLTIGPGVTLASDRGHNGSPGGILTSDALDTPVMIKIEGAGVRITGLRLQGPNPKRYLDHHHRAFDPGGEGHKYYYKFPTSKGITTTFPDLEIDNCEISAFSSAGISLQQGTGHHIHHNYIHKCQYNGLGYGVSHDVASSIIEYNIFNENRHSIAGTGRPGCTYTARNNVHQEISLSHCFDMHGGRDRKDGTDIAGSTIEIYNNTFHAPERAVVIRGVPENKCDVHNNWFLKHKTAEEAVRGSEKTVVHNNVYGQKPTKAI